MKKNLIILLSSLLLIINLFPINQGNATMLPDAFDTVFDKLNNFFNSDKKGSNSSVPEEKFLENEYLQEHFIESEEFFEDPELKQFYEDYLKNR